MKHTLILGLGNILKGDDGVGVAVVNELKKEVSSNKYLKIIDGGTLGLDLLNYVEWADILIIIDAVNIDKQPGTIIYSKINNLNIDIPFGKTSHEVDLEDLLFSAKLLGVLPEKIIFYGIQIEKISDGISLSRSVNENVDKLCAYIKKEIKDNI
ncbi:MAG: hydrogenase maturation protease [Deferribacterota bacterium]|nr:hydrogenase maturation protease [Deferribacterota bacterium]